MTALHVPVHVRQAGYQTQTRFDEVRRVALPIKTSVQRPDARRTDEVYDYDAAGMVRRRAVYADAEGGGRGRVSEHFYDPARVLGAFGTDVVRHVAETIAVHTTEYLAERRGSGS